MPLISGDIRHPHAPPVHRAAYNAVKSKLRKAGIVRSRSYVGQNACLEMCRSNVCRVYLTVNGSEYCGEPYWDRIISEWKGEFKLGCGCGLRNKISDPDSECPMGLWGKELIRRDDRGPDVEHNLSQDQSGSSDATDRPAEPIA